MKRIFLAALTVIANVIISSSSVYADKLETFWEQEFINMPKDIEERLIDSALNDKIISLSLFEKNSGDMQYERFWTSNNFKVNSKMKEFTLTFKKTGIKIPKKEEAPEKIEKKEKKDSGDDDELIAFDMNGANKTPEAKASEAEEGESDEVIQPNDKFTFTFSFHENNFTMRHSNAIKKLPSVVISNLYKLKKRRLVWYRAHGKTSLLVYVLPVAQPSPVMSFLICPRDIQHNAFYERNPLVNLGMELIKIEARYDTEAKASIVTGTKKAFASIELDSLPPGMLIMPIEDDTTSVNPSVTLTYKPNFADHILDLSEPVNNYVGVQIKALQRYEAGYSRATLYRGYTWIKKSKVSRGPTFKFKRERGLGIPLNVTPEEGDCYSLVVDYPITEHLYYNNNDKDK